MKPLVAALFLTSAAGLLSAAAMPGYVPGEDRPGGAATSGKLRNANAFSHPSADMPFERQLEFRIGDGIFKKQWVSAPSSTESSDGLGPLFNARACQNCHFKDGRGHPPEDGETASSFLIKLAVPARTGAHHVAAVPDPVYGGQLQTQAIQGLDAEARVTLAEEDVPVTLADGETVTLKKLDYRLSDLAYGPMGPNVMTSPRVAPPMIGMGLLELIPDEDIVSRADPDDRDGDGIRGVPQRVWSRVHQREMLGRFGWKAGAPTVPDQAAMAFSNDMGLSTPVMPASAGDCTEAQTDCREAPDGADESEHAEVTRKLFDLVVFYARNLAVPARVDAQDPKVLHGGKLFRDIGCAACHVPSHVTGKSADLPFLANQTIWPYTDLLLHDMGEGLADDFPEGVASGRQWRTPPLWGIGLTETVSGQMRLLHDGRARTVQEAILWHGGEGEGARDRYRNLSREDREALLAFVDSL